MSVCAALSAAQIGPGGAVGLLLLLLHICPGDAGCLLGGRPRALNAHVCTAAQQPHCRSEVPDQSRRRQSTIFQLGLSRLVREQTKQNDYPDQQTPPRQPVQPIQPSVYMCKDFPLLSPRGGGANTWLGVWSPTVGRHQWPLCQRASKCGASVCFICDLFGL